MGLEPTIVGLKVRCLTNLATGATSPRRYQSSEADTIAIVNIESESAPQQPNPVEADLEQAPDEALLERVEGEMMRVDATLSALGAGDADPAVLTAWIADPESS